MKNCRQLAFFCSLITCLTIQSSFAESFQLRPEKIKKIASEAFIFGYPLVLMDSAKAFLTSSRSSQLGAPLNHFSHLRKLPDASSEITNPTVDSLYSSAWLDLSASPIMLSVPDTGSHYYTLDLIDAYTNVFSSIGTRTTGNYARKFILIGPTWKGSLPTQWANASIRKIHSPTNTVWIIGKILCTQKKEYSLVHDIQDKIELSTLSSEKGANSFQKKLRKNKSDSSLPIQKIFQMPPEIFFRTMCALMKDNPPSPADAPALARFKKIGISLESSCDFSSLNSKKNSKLRQALESGMKAGMKKLFMKMMTAGQTTHGWRFEKRAGTYGTDYLLRAEVALTGLGAGRPVDQFYLAAGADSYKKPLLGEKGYTIHFSRNQLPPVHALWSITLVNDHWSFYNNPLHRYALLSNSPVRYNRDGSLDIYIQNKNPGKLLVSNWLPAPEGRFILNLRLYWPREAALSGVWTPPSIKPDRILSASALK